MAEAEAPTTSARAQNRPGRSPSCCPNIDKIAAHRVNACSISYSRKVGLHRIISPLRPPLSANSKDDCERSIWLRIWKPMRS